MSKEKDDKKVKKHILETFAKFVRSNKRHPTEAELQKMGVTRNAIRWHFNTVKELKVVAREEYPQYFKDIIDETLFTKKNLKKLETEASKYKRFVVTTAVAGAPVHEKFYKALKSYCEHNNAKLLIIPVKAPASSIPGTRGNNNQWVLDPIFSKNDDLVVFGDLQLNENLYISGIKISAKQIDPTTGLDRLANHSSFIYGSPKLRLKPLPNSNKKLPHIAMSTGAVTMPEYKTDYFMSLRTAHLADFDHKLSALVVELEGNGDDYYYIRQLQAEPKTGRFPDLGKFYYPSGSVGTLNPDAFSLGDWHSGETDPAAKKCWEEVVQETQPRRIILHDVFSGNSINHWTSGKVITKALQASKGETNLEEELKMTARDLNELAQWTEEGVVISKSNHDDFLIRYLEDGRFLKDHENFFTATEIIEGIKNGHDPLTYGVEKYMDEKAKQKTIWLERDEDFRIAGIECGAHGDKGPNGSRGTLRNLESAYGACVVGHSHTPGILRDAWQNGTSTYLQLSYNSGASSWMHASTLIYPNGARQMIFSINGKWRLKK